MAFLFYSSKNFGILSSRISFLYLDNSTKAMWIFDALIMYLLLSFRRKRVLSWLMASSLLASSMLSSRLSLKFLPTDYALISTYLLIKCNRPSWRIYSFLIEWLVHMRFLRLHTSDIERYSLNLILRELLIPLIGTSSSSYSWQEDLGNVRLVGLRFACSPELHLF